MTPQEAILILVEAGCENLKQEDEQGETKTGWWLDTVWLAPSNNPRLAVQVLQG